MPASLNVDIATKNKHDVDIREPGAFFAWGAEILLAVAKMFSGCNTAVIIGSAAVFLEEQAKGRQRHTDEYYPKQESRCKSLCLIQNIVPIFGVLCAVLLCAICCAENLKCAKVSFLFSE